MTTDTVTRLEEAIATVERVNDEIREALDVLRDLDARVARLEAAAEAESEAER